MRDIERDVPGWRAYRQWFAEVWAAGGRRAWATAVGHLLVGFILFGIALWLPVGGGGFGGLIYTLVLAVLLYAALAPPATPYVAWLESQWTDSDIDKILIVLGHVVGAFFLLAALLGLPFNGFMGALASVLFFTAVYAMVVLALNLHWGYTGFFNIGIAGFMAVGVYVMAIASTPQDATGGSIPGLGLPLPIGILLGVLAASLAGLLAALPALRLRADYFAIVTVALSEIIRLTFRATTFQRFSIFGVELGTGAASGKSMPDNPLRLLFYESHAAGADPAMLGEVLFPLFDNLRLPLIPANTYLFGVVPLPHFTLSLSVQGTVIVSLTYVSILMVFVGGFYWLLVRVGNSPFGRVLKAIREDELVARSLGKNTREFKIVSFMFGCGLMGLAGILWQGSQGFVNPQAFKPIVTFYLWIALIIGGAGSNTGAVLGSALFASVLWTGPVYLKQVIRNAVSLGSAPNNIVEALAPIFAGNLLPLFAFLLENVATLRLIFVGSLLVWLMQQRPDGLLGHRKEEAAAISLDRPHGGEGDE